ncbi:uncharacterized protein EAF02_010038 [Botrytis sinoallii]|uniref:uncharacterized protein n=1 Tax=Botrytis sinoallii TaxID=1463999 RepID=UPI001900F248|nr:uncharacterized protein EAF02_010038 [Botrytis sinoallii]KAF7865615.1 hypothetical protein EAF02_010038 [Botrytis sinoallii]
MDPILKYIILMSKTFPSTSPCTVYNLPALEYDASDILVVIGKVQGMGKFDSDTCHHHAKIWEMCTTPSTLKIFSRGTEGVLGTHVTLILKSKEPTGLCAVIGRTQDFLLGELGTSDHALIKLIWDTGELGAKKAYCVPSIEREDCGLLMIATNNRTTGNLRAISTVMTHPIDVNPIQEALKKIKDDGGNLIQVFATINPIKGEPVHVRAAVGGQLAALCVNTNIYVSGGGDGQGPWGGGNLSEMNALVVSEGNSGLNIMAIPGVDSGLNTMVIPGVNDQDTMVIPQVYNGLNTIAEPEVTDGLNITTIFELSTEPKRKRSRLE